ncbi:T3SS (YopN, CesT) and YbjN peptide-binding chaperone 1 [Gordonia rubripertincta]|uniref:Uncharacterized protein n=1 Tax=Gordonia rubripertincta TaxID=36822 RepID=A0ABT4MZ33_GORRU|nr:hypothetical protein [Gordonia rubripertincta]MCZ4552252.1 hypothetical protein [Gordonia rubripertincta]
MSNIFDFDASAADGWAAFRDELATRLTGLQASATVRVSAPNAALDGSGPAALFTVTDDDEVRCVLGPTLLGLAREIDDAELSLLMELEWDSICADECVVERPRDEIELVVNAATAVMQELWQVVHPTFLLTVHETPPSTPIIAVQPTGQAHLRALVDDAVERMTGSAATKDDDGDITFTVNDETSWLCVDAADPVLEMFANLPVDVQDSTTASAALMTFSSTWPDIRFVLHESHVRVSIRMDATVFTDAVLRSTLIKWFDFLTEGSGEVAKVVARAAPDVEVTDGGLPAGLMVILQLDDTDHGPLSPHEIATICNFDRDDILQYLRVSEEQELSWRSSIYDALSREDEEEAAACEHEEKAWSATVKSLREALRLVVLTSRLDEVR